VAEQRTGWRICAGSESARWRREADGGELIVLWNRKRVAYPVTKIRSSSRAGGRWVLAWGKSVGVGVWAQRIVKYLEILCMWTFPFFWSNRAVL